MDPLRTALGNGPDPKQLSVKPACRRGGSRPPGAEAPGCDTATAGDAGGNCASTCVDGTTACATNADCGASTPCMVKANPTARCCDMASNTWDFQVCAFSEYYVGDLAGDLIPGKGSPTSDCVMEWAVLNTFNSEGVVDKTGLANFKQTCTDGDPSCDGDGAKDGKCTFQIGMCFNLDDKRLQSGGQVECTPSDVVSWEIKAPRPDTDKKPYEQDNALALRAAVEAVAPSSVGGKSQEVVTFDTPVSPEGVCTALADVVVALKDRGNGEYKKAKGKIKARAVTSPPPGGSHGTKDSDKLILTCLPGE